MPNWFVINSNHLLRDKNENENPTKLSANEILSMRLSSELVTPIKYEATGTEGVMNDEFINFGDRRISTLIH